MYRIYPKRSEPFGNFTAPIVASVLILHLLFKVGEITIKAILQHPLVKQLKARHQSAAIARAIWELKRKRMIIAKKNAKTFQLTKKGSRKALFASVCLSQRIKIKPASWDQTWRVVIFDIREKQRSDRNYLRDVLKGLGFFKLQKSTWVTPYPIPDVLQDVLIEIGVLEHTRIMHVDEIDDDNDLRAHFEFPKFA